MITSSFVRIHTFTCIICTSIAVGLGLGLGLLIDSIAFLYFTSGGIKSQNAEDEVAERTF